MMSLSKVLRHYATRSLASEVSRFTGLEATKCVKSSAGSQPHADEGAVAPDPGMNERRCSMEHDKRRERDRQRKVRRMCPKTLDIWSKRIRSSNRPNSIVGTRNGVLVTLGQPENGNNSNRTYRPTCTALPTIATERAIGSSLGARKKQRIPSLSSVSTRTLTPMLLCVCVRSKRVAAL